MTEADRKWVINNKDKVKKSLEEWKSRNPWRSSYDSAKARCKENGKYGRRGIKLLMEVKDFKYLWVRDKAYSMKRPTIDRKDTTGNYTISNCQFIEFENNINKPKCTGWMKYKKCKICKTTKIEHSSFGICKKCYRKKYLIEKGK